MNIFIKNNNYFSNTLLLSIFMLAVNTVNTAPLSYKQAHNYLEHALDTLLVPNLQAGYYAQEVDMAIDTFVKELLREKKLYKHDSAHTRVYDSNKLYQKLLEKVVSYIERKSLEYAHKELNNFYVASSVSKDNFARQIAHKMKKQVLSKIDNSFTLESGVLMHYVGGYLRSKVHETIKKELKYTKKNKSKKLSSKSHKAKKHYKTAECPICYENFSTYIKRIYLQCGHNFCSDCLTQMAKRHGTYISCPLCRATVPVKVKTTTYVDKPMSYCSEYTEYTTPIYTRPVATVIERPYVTPYPVYTPVLRTRTYVPYPAYTPIGYFGFGLNLNL